MIPVTIFQPRFVHPKWHSPFARLRQIIPRLTDRITGLLTRLLHAAITLFTSRMEYHFRSSAMIDGSFLRWMTTAQLRLSSLRPGRAVIPRDVARIFITIGSPPLHFGFSLVLQRLFDLLHLTYTYSSVIIQRRLWPWIVARRVRLSMSLERNGA